MMHCFFFCSDNMTVNTFMSVKIIISELLNLNQFLRSEILRAFYALKHANVNLVMSNLKYKYK